MIRLLLPLLVVAALVAVAVVLLAGQRRESRRHAIALARVRQVTDLAYLHDEISTGLAGAVIGRTRGLGPDSAVLELESALDDVLDLAREHRAQEPDLATIVIDTVRTRELS